jgi:DNA-binding response OmpR family regulator
MARLLIVEDDELLRDGLDELLTRAGHTTRTASNGEAALAQLQAQVFDGMVLDLGLPQVDGMTVLRLLRLLRARQSAMPVLILTARDGVEDRVEGLNAGADDYLTKPFSMDELLARLQSMLRRASLPAFGASASPAPALQPPADTQATTTHTLSMDAQLPRAWLGSTALDLTPREWALLDLLLNQQGQVVSREAVLAAWQAQPGEPGAAGTLSSNALEVYVHRLRRKLAGSAYGIRNIRGLGYLLDGPGA